MRSALRSCRGAPAECPWQEVPVSKTDVRVNEEDIQISVKLDMLKAVVQQQSIDMELTESLLTRRKSIFVDHDGVPWRVLLIR